MSDNRRPKLPRGLRWRAKSPYIWFSWRDERGRQHQQSTGTTDVDDATVFRIRFLREKEGRVRERGAVQDQSLLPLAKVGDLYFAWKVATNSSGTISREKRLFKQVEKFIGAKTPLRSIDVELIREYQQERRKQISPTMRRAVSARTVNYELQLLRGVMQFANCWKGDLAERDRPLKQAKSRIGKAATNEQLKRIIEQRRKTNTGNWQCTARLLLPGRAAEVGK